MKYVEILNGKVVPKNTYIVLQHAILNSEESQIDYKLTENTEYHIKTAFGSTEKLY